MTESKVQMIVTSLHMRANYIETGDVLLTKNDVISINNVSNDYTNMKETTTEQDELIVALRKLANKLSLSD